MTGLSNGHGGGVEPTPTQLAAASSLEDIAALVGMRQEAITHLVGILGEESVTVQDIAALPEGDLSALLDPLLAPDGTEFRPTLVDKARAIRMHRACNDKVGGRRSGTSPTHTAPSADRKMKLSALVDTTIEAELQPLDPTTVAAMFERYKALRGDYPLNEHEPTPDQLAAVQQLIRADVPPYVDFSIFGPHGKRMTKKIHLVAHVYDPSSGSYQRQELPGPPNFESWWRCWSVFRCAMLLLEEAKPEPLDHYGELIRDLAHTFSTQCWFIIYQADTRMRHEELDRIRRRMLIDELPPQSWGDVFARAVRHREFWETEVRQKAMLYLTRVKTRTETTYDGTAQAFLQPGLRAIQIARQPGIERGQRSWRANQGRAIRGQWGAIRQADNSMESATGPIRPQPSHRQGPYSPQGNQTSMEICNNWNRGACVQNGPCPSGRSHVCSLCRGVQHPPNHMRIQCPLNQSPPTQGMPSNPATSAKGKGKGKGKNKSKR